MPIYEYQCQACQEVFSHFWPSFSAAAQAQEPPACPVCQNRESQRVVSQVAVLGELGGMTPTEKAQENAQAERMASITPKEQIQQFQANRAKKRHADE